MSSGELFTQLIYFGMAHLHMTFDEVMAAPFGFICDMQTLWFQETGLLEPYHETTIDDIFPVGI